MFNQVLKDELLTRAKHAEQWMHTTSSNRLKWGDKFG